MVEQATLGVLAADVDPGSLHTIGVTLPAVQSSTPPHNFPLCQAVHSCGEQSPAWKWRYILAGGAPPVDQMLTAGAGDLLVTGHRDGRVRLWDASAQVRAPQNLTLETRTVEIDGHGARHRRRRPAGDRPPRRLHAAVGRQR